MRGGIQICYPHVILYCGSLDQHRFAREKIWMNQKKNHLHAVSRLKAVNEEEDQGKRAERSWDVGFTLGILFFVCSSHDIIFINYDSDDAVVCKPWEGEFRGR
ncbi:uncharacterized protein LOC111200356 [Brassica napus]|uniref:(rape) hypothetical protein n=2 Tax=Brassica napus TaxID=3708 RepID=A0A817B591_BRANA|nr:uncharacterized protein LOC111200356 [Brassica napus]CAF2325164.1 unnamed protein product [Brassica napus]